MKKRVLLTFMVTGLCLTSACGTTGKSINSTSDGDLKEALEDGKGFSSSTEASAAAESETDTASGAEIVLDEKQSFIVEAARAVYECDGLDGLKEKMDEIAPDSLYAMQDEYYMWASDDLDIDEGTYTWYLTYDLDDGVGFAYLDAAQDAETMDVVTSTLNESGYPVEAIGSINDSSLLRDLSDSEIARKIFTTTEDDGVYGYYAANLMMTVSEYESIYGIDEDDDTYAASEEVSALMPDGWEAYYQDEDVVACQSSSGIDVEFWTAIGEWSSVSDMLNAYGSEYYELAGTYSGTEVWRELHTYDDSSWYTYYALIDGHEFDFSDYDLDITDSEIEDAISVAQVLSALFNE